MIYLLIRWMNTSRVKYSIIGTYFFGLFLLVVDHERISNIMDKIERYKKRKGMQLHVRKTD